MMSLEDAHELLNVGVITTVDDECTAVKTQLTKIMKETPTEPTATLSGSALFTSQLAGIISTSGYSLKNKQLLEKAIEAPILRFFMDFFALPPATSLQYFPQTSNAKGLVLVCRAALFKLKNAYYGSSKELSPVIYLADDEAAFESKITIQRNWSEICHGTCQVCNSPVIRFVPLCAQSEKMDVQNLESMIEQDMANKKIPCLIICRAGTTISGEMDNLVAIKNISNFCWVHVQGPILSLLASSTKQGREVEVARKADSMTLDFGAWYGVDAPAVIAFLSVDWSQAVGTDIDMVFSHKAKVLVYDEAAGAFVASKLEVKSAESSKDAGTILPLYSFINKYSILDERISQAFELAQIFYSNLLETDTITGLCDVSFLTCLVRYHDVDHVSANKFLVAPENSAIDNVNITKRNHQIVEETAYRTAKNNKASKYIFSWLEGQHTTKLNLCLVEIEGTVFIRYSPSALQQSCVIEAVNSITEESARVASVFASRRIFRDIAGSFPCLRPVSVSVIKPTTSQIFSPYTCALGGLRYIPSFLSRYSDEDLSTEIIEEIERVNKNITERIVELGRAHGWDRLFLSGTEMFEEGGSRGCLIIGIDVTPFSPETIRETMTLVADMGLQEEQEQGFEDRISTLVKDGIRQAEKEMEKTESSLIGSLVGYGLGMFGYGTSAVDPILKQKSFDLGTGFKVNPINFVEVRADSAVKLVDGRVVIFE